MKQTSCPLPSPRRRPHYRCLTPEISVSHDYSTPLFRPISALAWWVWRISHLWATIAGSVRRSMDHLISIIPPLCHVTHDTPLVKSQKCSEKEEEKKERLRTVEGTKNSSLQSASYTVWAWLAPTTSPIMIPLLPCPTENETPFNPSNQARPQSLLLPWRTIRNPPNQVRPTFLESLKRAEILNLRLARAATNGDGSSRP